MNIYEIISETVWSPSFWLPPNTTWNDFAPRSQFDVIFSGPKDLLWPLPIAIALLIIRYFVEKCIFIPLGKSLGIKNKQYERATPNTILDIAYNKCNRIDRKTVIGLTKQVDMSEREIERWWRHRRAQDKPTKLRKFCESLWRFVYYGFSLTFGLHVLWGKPWLWDVRQCWYDYPNHSMDTEIWVFTVITMSFYWSLIISPFLNIKRKDFGLTFAHHTITLLIVMMSWICHFHRVASLIIVLHDLADITLDGLKTAKYAKYQKLCIAISIIFLVVSFVTKLGIYPWIVYSSVVHAQEIVPLPIAHYTINGLQLILLCLNFSWSYMILKKTCLAIKSNKFNHDICSCSSESFSDTLESVN